MAKVVIDLEMNAKGEVVTKVAAGLDEIEAKSAKAKKGLSGMFEGIDSGSITSLFGMGVTGATALAGAVATATAAVTALGIRGADVADVTGAFNSLQAAAGNTGDTIGVLRSAFKGTISDFDIMKATNLAFSQGLKLTTSELDITARGSRLLADAVGGDAKTAYETLTMAMATGQDRTLKTIGLNIDAAAAIEKHAASLGVQKGALTEAQQMEAKRHAILEALREKLDATGDAEMDFAERVAAGRVAVQNFTDGLGMAVAQSPVVNAAMESISKAVLDAFGKNQQSTIQTLIGWVNKFVIGLVDGASMAVSAAQFIADGWGSLKFVFNAVVAAAMVPLKSFVDALITVVAAAETLPGVGPKVQPLLSTLRSMSGAMGSFAEGMAESGRSIVSQGSAFDKLQAEIGKFKAGLIAAEGTTVKASAAVQQIGRDARGAAGGGFEPLASALDKVAKAEKEVEKAAAEAEAFKALFGGPATSDIVQGAEVLKQYDLSLGSIGETLRNGPRPGEVFITQLTEPVTKAKKETDSWAKALEALSQTFTALGVSAESALARIVVGLLAGGTAAEAFRRATTNTERGIAALTVATTAYQSGALGGAAAGAQFGAAVGSVIPGVGTLVGAIGGGLVGAFLGFMGSSKRAAEELKRMRAEFIESHGGIDELRRKADLAGVSLDSLFGAKNAAQLQVALRYINGQLDEYQRRMDLHAEAWRKAEDAAKRYNLTVEELGPTWGRQRLDEQAMQLYEDYQLLTAAGANHEAVLKKMAPAFSEYVQTAMRAGISIPENMRPILEQLLKMGLLTDENGEALKDLNGITFSQELSKQFEALILKVGELVDVLLGVDRGIRKVDGRTVNVHTRYTSEGTPPWDEDGGGDGGGGDNDQHQPGVYTPWGLTRITPLSVAGGGVAGRSAPAPAPVESAPSAQGDELGSLMRALPQMVGVAVRDAMMTRRGRY